MSRPALPADDGSRSPLVAGPDDPGLTHVAVAGGTYTVLVAGADTAGRYALIDMLVPDGSGPPPHRHDFEEAFHVLEGEVEVTVRGQAVRATAGQVLNVPANAPHRFRNVSGRPARLLCLVAPAGLEAFFGEVGDPVASRTAPAPALSPEERAVRARRAAELGPRYGIESLPAAG